jgi:hypothetical protein
MTHKKRNKQARITNRQAKITHLKKLKRKRKAKFEQQTLMASALKHRMKLSNLPPEEIKVYVSNDD